MSEKIDSAKRIPPHILASIASGRKMVADANLQNAADWLGCTLGSSSTQLQTQLATAVHTQPTTLMARKSYIDSLRHNATKLAPKWNDRFQRIQSLEKTLVPFFKGEQRDTGGGSVSTASERAELEDDALAQISFQHSLLKPLNHVPWMIALIALFKVWAVPAMTVLFPVLAWILPYLLLKFVYTLPISQDEYFTILKSLWSGTLGSSLEFNADGMPKIPSFWNSKSLFQIALFAFSFLQGIIQPIQNAMHLHKTDSIFWGLGRDLLELRGLVEEIRADLASLQLPPFKICGALQDLDPLDYRRSFILVKEQPERLFITLKDMASLEILWRIATKAELRPVIFKRGEFRFKGVADISVGNEAAKSSLDLESAKEAHAVITGPNGGGKSSFLRSVLQVVLFGHTYGYAPAEKAAMPRFLWIACGLQLRDSPGKLSMFETEISYAAEALRLSSRSSEPGLVLFDELFHSTNPPDATRTAELFLQSLWKSRHTFSIVSTHVFPLVEKAPKGSVKAICCPATEKEDGQIKYSYAVEAGICRVSSVKKVWEKFGLAAAAAGAARGESAKPPNERESRAKDDE